MKNSFLLGALLSLTIFGSSTEAKELKLDPARSEVTEEKGSRLQAASYEIAKGGEKNTFMWKVETSPEVEFDFDRLIFLVNGKVNEGDTIVLKGDLVLAPDHFMDVELVTDDGATFSYAIKTDEVGGEGSYRLPLREFSFTGDEGKSFPYSIKAVRFMISGDKSAEPGTNSLNFRCLETE